jgi:hypothetical protein
VTIQATDDFDPNLPDDEPSTLPLDEVIRQAIEGRALTLRVCQPAKIAAIVGEQLVDVQPLFKVRYRNAAQPEEQAVIHRVPVSMPMGANYSIKLPIAVGDVGWCVFADRAMDAFMADTWDGSSTVDPANTRCHHITDPIFIPGLASTAHQTQDGTTDLVISCGPAQVRVRQDGKLQLKNSSAELLGLVDQLLAALGTLLSAFTAAAPALVTSTAPGNPAPMNPTLATAITTAHTTISTVQSSLDTMKV